MSDAHIAERLNDLYVVADTFADRLSEMATLLQDDLDQVEVTNLLTAALGGMEAVEALLKVAQERSAT